MAQVDREELWRALDAHYRQYLIEISHEKCQELKGAIWAFRATLLGKADDTPDKAKGDVYP